MMLVIANISHFLQILCYMTLLAIESGLKIHTTRKHPTIEQLDGSIEDFQIKNKHWRKEYERHDEFIEDYLMTGEISQEITGNDIKDHLEILQFLLSPPS